MTARPNPHGVGRAHVIPWLARLGERKAVTMTPIESFIVLVNELAGPLVHEGSSAVSQLSSTLGLF